MNCRANYIDEFLRNNGLEYEKWFCINEFPGVRFLIDRCYRLNISNPTEIVKGMRVDFVYDNLLAGIFHVSAINEGMDYLRRLIGIKVGDVFNVVNEDGEIVVAGDGIARYRMENDSIIYLNGDTNKPAWGVMGKLLSGKYVAAK